MKRILITGASGMLGRAVAAELDASPSYQLLKLAFQRAGAGFHAVDLTDPESVREVFSVFRPDCVIHCAAERRPDVSERDPDAASRLNIDATARLAALCHDQGAWLVYLSTDYVFDGARPPYAPDDAPHPLNHYGATKLAGENAVREILPDALVLRVPVLFGPVERLDESAVTAISSAVLNRNPAKLDHWSVRYPTYTPDVAALIRQLLSLRGEGASLGGTFHWSGDEAFTKYEMALRLGQLFAVPTDHLQPDSTPPAGAPRPRDCHLDCHALEALGIGRRTPFAEALDTVTRPFRQPGSSETA